MKSLPFILPFLPCFHPSIYPANTQSLPYIKEIEVKEIDRAPSSAHLQLLHGKQRDAANLKRLERRLRFPVTWNTHILWASSFCARDWADMKTASFESTRLYSRVHSEKVGARRPEYDSKFPERDGCIQKA